MIVLYLRVSTGFVRRIVVRIGDSRVGYILAVSVASVIFASVATLCGELWAGLAECLRVLNTHGSYRVLRMPWAQHREIAFAGCLFAFWLGAAYVLRSETSTLASRDWLTRVGAGDKSRQII